MSDIEFEQPPEATIEVRVRRHGVVVHQERCDSPEQAAEVVDAWSDVEDVECEIVDLLGAGEEPELLAVLEEDAYPTAYDQDAGQP